MGLAESHCRPQWLSAVVRTATLLAFTAAVEGTAQQTSTPGGLQQPTGPVLTRRPSAKAQQFQIPEGKIKLDVMVNDAEGRPAFGLQPGDFKILDDGQPR